MNEPDETLPYVFDLMYDIKTKQELVDEMSELETRLSGLQNLIESQGVDLSEITPIDRYPEVKALASLVEK